MRQTTIDVLFPQCRLYYDDVQSEGPYRLYSRLIGRVFFAPVRFMIIEILRILYTIRDRPVA